jgi:CDP-diacylglycerol--glycerol-3-phosphate 3-phosphatidyltransferase
MLYREPLFTLPTYRIGEWLTYVAAALTLWSMIDYLRAAWPAMRAHD